MSLNKLVCLISDLKKLLKLMELEKMQRRRKSIKIGQKQRKKRMSEQRRTKCIYQAGAVREEKGRASICGSEM